MTEKNKKYFENLHEIFRNHVQNMPSGTLAIYTRDAQETLATIQRDSLIISDINRILLEEATEECIKRIESAGEIENMMNDHTRKQMDELLEKINEDYEKMLKQNENLK